MKKADARLSGEIQVFRISFSNAASYQKCMRQRWLYSGWMKNMNRSLSWHLPFVISAWRKLAIMFITGIAFATCDFPAKTLANDASQTSKGLHAQITQAQAEKAALAKVLGGKVKSANLARENGQLIWSIDVIKPITKKIVAVQVDAKTGKVLSKLTQTPGDRAEESRPSQKKNQ
ncbi:MAG: PepSY domain-containing protein [Verrucomicrobia bacterium]|nr:PepSY domain-containing protein [Verrucomicrobiota bacterium]